MNDLQNDYQSLLSEYLSNSTRYSIILDIIKCKLEDIAREVHIKCEIEGRVKEVNSFIAKSIKKKCQNPLIEITDKIGIRVITIYESDLLVLEREISKKFNVVKHDNKLNSLEYNQLGYLGTHIEIIFDTDECNTTQVGDDEICEIQLQTKAQNLWASISHPLIYKPSEHISVQVNRSIFRLIALIEIFDKEVTSARESIINQSEYPEVKMLSYLEKCFSGFTSRHFNRELSLQNLSELKVLFNTDEITDFESLINNFTKDHYEKLKQIFVDYENDTRQDYRVFLIFQPESLLIYERLIKNKFKIKELWANLLPIDLLYFLASVWGISLPNS